MAECGDRCACRLMLRTVSSASGLEIAQQIMHGGASAIIGCHSVMQTSSLAAADPRYVGVLPLDTSAN